MIKNKIYIFKNVINIISITISDLYNNFSHHKSS